MMVMRVSSVETTPTSHQARCANTTLPRPVARPSTTRPPQHHLASTPFWTEVAGLPSPLQSIHPTYTFRHQPHNEDRTSRLPVRSNPTHISSHLRGLSTLLSRAQSTASMTRHTSNHHRPSPPPSLRTRSQSLTSFDRPAWGSRRTSTTPNATTRPRPR
jgi:hypothetical protein